MLTTSSEQHPMEWVSMGTQPSIDSTNPVGAKSEKQRAYCTVGLQGKVSRQAENVVTVQWFRRCPPALWPKCLIRDSRSAASPGLAHVRIACPHTHTHLQILGCDCERRHGVQVLGVDREHRPTRCSNGSVRDRVHAGGNRACQRQNGTHDER